MKTIMPRKERSPLPLLEQMRKLREASLTTRHAGETKPSTDSDIVSVEERVTALLGIIERQKKNRDRMLFFVMYDIESNKVRTLIHKYLKRKGCTPIQRSIFLANTSMDVYEEIKADLVAVQEAYENNDSIIVLPVSSDYLRMMKIIGQKIEVDVITHSRNTLFF